MEKKCKIMPNYFETKNKIKINMQQLEIEIKKFSPLKSKIFWIF